MQKMTLEEAINFYDQQGYFRYLKDFDFLTLLLLQGKNNVSEVSSHSNNMCHAQCVKCQSDNVSHILYPLFEKLFLTKLENSCLTAKVNFKRYFHIQFKV